MITFDDLDFSTGFFGFLLLLLFETNYRLIVLTVVVLSYRHHHRNFLRKNKSGVRNVTKALEKLKLI